MGSHGNYSLFCVFSFTRSAHRRPRAVFRGCFEIFSWRFRLAAFGREELATLRDVVLDRAELARVLGVEIPTGAKGVKGVAYDSRRVEPGFAFVAIPGFRRDGVEFVPEALRRGARLVVAEHEIPGMPSDVPVTIVPDARGALAALACAVFGEPSEGTAVYGVTGTNGKTTTSYALYSIFAAAYTLEKCGLMSTAEAILGGERRPVVR